MVEEIEVVTLLLGVAVLALVIYRREQIKPLRFYQLLVLSFVILFCGWLFTVVETFIWEDFFNLLEHLCYSASSIVLAIWCWKSFYRPAKSK
jgi:hypothetical protein